MTGVAESQDVIDAPDAALIAKGTPGRGYVRTGHAPLQVFQSARVGGRRPGLAAAQPAPVRATPVPWSALGLPPPPVARAEAEPDQDQTDLHALVDAVRAATADLPPQRSPWLEALPELVPLSTLLATADCATVAAARRPLRPVPYGLADLPEQRDVS